MSDQGDPDAERRALNAPQGEALSGPGRFAAPRYSGTEYGAAAPSPTGLPPLDQPYDRDEYGHYDKQYYSPAHTERPTMFPLPDGVGYASWGSRFAAFVIDIVALTACSIPAAVAAALVGSTLNAGESAGTGAVLLVWLTGLLGAVAWWYQISWRQGACGQSWGKRVMRIHLVSANDFRPPGGPVGLGRYVVRSSLAGLSGGIYLFVTAVWPLSDIRLQSVDDKMFNTLVVRLSSQRAVF